MSPSLLAALLSLAINANADGADAGVVVANDFVEPPMVTAAK